MVARNSVLNLIGLGGPILFALVAIPLLIHALGVQRFGALALIWATVNYVSALDLGLGRALTRQVASSLGKGDKDRLEAQISTALWLLLGVGLTTAGALVLLAPVLVKGILAIPASLEAETLGAIYMLALSPPIATLAGGLRSILETHDRFGSLNAIRLLMGFFTFFGPLVALHVDDSLIAIAAVLTLGRLVALAIHAIVGLHAMPGLRTRFTFNSEHVKPLMISGGWMTMGSVINPLIGYMDRLVVGSVISLGAVAYYVTPSEIVTKLWVIPAALTGALFPEFASRAASDSPRVSALFGQSVKILLLVLLPFTFSLAVFAHDFLLVWVGKEIADNSASVLRLLSFGILVSCLAHVPFSLCQALGRADVVAKLLLLQVPFYVAALYVAAHVAGIEGVAIAWVLRMVVDTYLMFYVADRKLGFRMGPRSVYIKQAALVAVAFLAAVYVAQSDWQVKFVGYAAFLVVATWFVWVHVFVSEERLAIQSRLRPGLHR